MKNKIINSLFLLLLLFSYNLNAQVTKDISDTIEEALTAVVTVAIEKEQPIANVLMGFRGDITEKAYEKSLELSNALTTGSGFIITRNGKKYVVTNSHVVESASDEAESVFIYSYNGDKYEMKVVGGDSFFDVAVLEFVTPPKNNLGSMEFAKEMPKIASSVYAMGNPLGDYPNTITDGIISALNRMRGSATGRFGFIQSTATVIWGNSGGPLVNVNGEVVGINSQITFAPDGSLQQQINLALDPIISNRIVTDVIKDGRLNRAHIGVEIQENRPVYNTFFGTRMGAPLNDLPIIGEVFVGSDAAEKLLRYRGWQIKAINNKPVRNIDETLEQFERVKPYEQVAFTVTNGVEEHTVNVATTLLDTGKLAGIALYILDRYMDLGIDNSSAQVRVFTSQLEIPSPDNAYYILAGGDEYGDLWRITTLSDLGGLFRVYGVRGEVDLILGYDADDDYDTEVLYKRFTDVDDQFRKVLWY